MIGCCFNGCVINHLYYADAIVLMSPTSKGMQELINLCEIFAINHEMKFNESKSILLFFKPIGIQIKPQCNVYMNGSHLRMDCTYKYLGHIITDDLKDNNDIQRQIRGFYAKSNMLLRTFSKCSYLVKKHLFMSYCGSIYSMYLWCSYGKKYYRRMEVAYNNVFRRLLGYDKRCSASGMFVNERVDNFETRKRRLIYSFKNRLYSSENYLINTIVNSSKWSKSALFQMWQNSLYVMP